MNDILTQACEVMRTVFGFSEFRSGQEAVLQDILQQKDVMVVMPTGGGKSLLYQLPAVLRKGTVLVISPLISLMQDQVASLRQRNIAAAFINSSLSGEEKRMATQAMEAGRYRLVYVSPERLQYPEFQEALRRTQISMLAIDEAHCISQWGHDFRPDYLKIKEIRELLGRPQTAALTATATEEVCQEIAEKLGTGEWRIHVAGFNRENLYFDVRQVRGQQDKIDQIREIYRSYGGSGIVYAGTRKNVEYVAENLKAHDIPVAPYHAGMEDDVRHRVQQNFMDEKVPVVVATNAFGMGINKANIRFVVHFDIPADMEAYYQEVGRAGRDGKHAYCCLLFNYADTRIPRFFIEESHPADALVMMVANLIKMRKAVPSDEELLALPDVKTQMCLRYILNLLEQAALVSKATRDTYVYGAHAHNAKLLQQVLRLDRERKHRDEDKLEQMIRYAYHTGCRRRWILDYFGDHTPQAKCHTCDNCVRKDGQEEVLGERRIEVLKALSAVTRLNNRIGKNRMAEVLVGSKSQKLLELNLHKIPTYGALKYMTLEAVGQLLDILVQVGYIEVKLKDGQYPILSLTQAGHDVVMSRIPCFFPKGCGVQSQPAKRGKNKKKKTGRKAQSSETPTASFGSSDSAACKAEPADNQTSPESPADDALYEKLSQLRRDIAAEIGKPAFVVFPNTTIQEMARRKPKTLAELGEIPGVGKFKLQHYGIEFLAVIQEHTVCQASPR